MPRIPKKFAVISDIHARAGEEGECVERIINLDYKLQKAGYPLYYLGDLVEGYDSHTNFENINYAVRGLIMEAAMDGRAVCGNHDNRIPELKELPDRIYDGQRRVLLTHGQRFDFWFKDEAAENSSDWWSKLAFRTGSIGLWRTERWLRKFNNWGFVDNALEYANANNIRLIVTGHTHEPRIVRVNNTTVATGGTWKNGARDDELTLVLVEGYNAMLAKLGEI